MEVNIENFDVPENLFTARERSSSSDFVIPFFIKLLMFMIFLHFFISSTCDYLEIVYRVILVLLFHVGSLLLMA